MADTVRVKVEIQNGDAAVKTLTEIANLCDRINGKSATFRVDSGNLRSFTSQLKEIENAVTRVNRTQITPQINTSGLDNVLSTLDRISTVAHGISSVFSGANAAIGGVGNAFTGMSDLFSIDLLNTSKRYLTAMATRMVTQNIGDIMNRYDILTTFTPYMQIAGVNSSTANAALQRVNQSILGLPIGLDEAAYRLRRYQMFVGDTEQATNLTIGLQNALTAGGASQSMKNTAYMEMERLLTSGDLATWRQWQALITGFGVSSRFIADAMSELSGKQIDVKELARGLHDGSVSADDLLQAIEYLGKDWSEVPDNLVPKFVKDMNAALDVYKGTLEAWVSNIKFAVTRGGANVLTSLNETMQAEEGMGIVDVMKGIRDTINEIFGAGSSFIESHPEGIGMFFDMAGNFMDRAKGLDWTLFSENVIGNIGRLANMAFSAFDAIPPGALEEFASFAITIAGPAGGLIKVMQSGLPQMLAVFEAFKDFDFESFVGNVTDQLGTFTTVVGGILNVFDTPATSNLAAFALVWGPALAKTFSLIGSAASGLSSALGFIFSNGLAPAAGIAAPLVALAGMVYGGSKYIQQQQEAYGQSVVDQIYGDNTEFLTNTARIVSDYNSKKTQWDQAETDIFTQGETAAAIVTRIKEINDTIMSSSISPNERENLKNELKANIGLLSDIYPDVQLGMLDNKPVLDETSEHFINTLSKDYLDLKTAEAYIDKIAPIRAEAALERTSLLAEQEVQRSQFRAIRETRNRALADYLEQASIRDSMTVDQFEDIDAFTSAYTAQGQKALNAKSVYEQSVKDFDAARESLEELGMSIDDVDARLEKYNLDWQTYSDTVKKLEGRSFFFENEIRNWDALTDAEKDAIAAYDSYLEKARESDNLPGFGRTADKGNVSVGENTGNIAWNNARQEMYYDYMQRVWDWYGTLSPEDQARALPLMKKIREEGFGGRDNLYGIGDAIEGAKGYIPEAVAGLVDELAEQITAEDNVDEVESRFDALINGGMYNAINSASQSDRMDAMLATLHPKLREKVGQLWNIFSNINPFGGTSEQAEEASEGIEPFNETIETTSDNAVKMRQKMEDARNEMEYAGRYASIQAAPMSNFSGTLGQVGQSASTAASMVQALADAINSLHDVDVNIRVAVQGAALGSALMSGAQGLWNSVSGLMHKSADGGWAGHGGLYNGPIGTDTIPTWLSPGEFVVNSKSAKRFGPTLEAINGMNIDAAFDSLMHNLARPSGMFMPNVTYNRDNHAQVNNYFSGETGQGYSQRKAYAWASKL